MPFVIAQELVLNSPFKPEAGLVRTVVASVFNRDVGADDKLSEAETMAVLGTKLLLDMGHTQEHAQTIFRHYRNDLETWTSDLIDRFHKNYEKPGPLILVILDNQVTTMLRIRGHIRKEHFDFKKATDTEAPSRPVLQVGITLSRLFSLVLGDPKARLYPRLLAEATEAERQADQSAR